LFGGQFQAHGRGDRGSTIEKFPKSYKFTIGGRIETINVLKALIEATYTMDARSIFGRQIWGSRSYASF